MGFMIIESRYKTDLIKRVNERLTRGYVFHGPLNVTLVKCDGGVPVFRYHQALFRAKQNDSDISKTV